MKHQSSQTLFAHWDERRGTKVMPERSEIDPGAIRSALGDTFVLSFNPLTEHPFRLAGTRVCALFGRELRASAFDALWDEESQVRIAEILRGVADDSIGVVASATAHNIQNQSVDLELILLPLSHGGRSHLRLIGALAPLVPPWWLGASRVRTLQLGGYRYLGHQPSAAVLAFPTQPNRVHGWRVYEGGRS